VTNSNKAANGDSVTSNGVLCSKTRYGVVLWVWLNLLLLIFPYLLNESCLEASQEWRRRFNKRYLPG